MRFPLSPPNTGDKLRSGARVRTANRRGHEAALLPRNGAAESFVSFIPLFDRVPHILAATKAIHAAAGTSSSWAATVPSSRPPVSQTIDLRK